MGIQEGNAGPRAPIELFLEKAHPAEASALMGYLQYEGDGAEGYRYRNKVTRSLIVVDGNGSLVSCDKNALHTIAIYKSIYPKRKYRRKEKRA
ncbi:hypothetical protein D3P07_23530 [Paenibacillus sp. 1011MAR3C5]|uniref:hypothetical protein n=1 Tax=Paenibacillus sp. 1011MAR3C5 TaxID=1675787 RepID=UPI000E6BC4A3|nr:hypothetical protein [Paenibacillus sp. 1011MAR3C5]RJE84339.1 hypothetical protein D3P07_23530 [Paenibacillus sp. 1011MAR3C5]